MSYMTTNRASVKDAINTILINSSMSPILELDSNENDVDVAIAKAILEEKCRAIQTKGWKFNTEEDFKFIPTGDGEIIIPDTVIKFKCIEKDVIQKGLRAYDRTDKTYVFDDPVYATVTLFVDWELLPQTAREYITVVAARTFSKRMNGEDDGNLTAKDELDAKTELEREQSLASPFKIQDY